jgi:hypothetical protein
MNVEKEHVSMEVYVSMESIPIPAPACLDLQGLHANMKRTNVVPNPVVIMGNAKIK